MSVAMQQLMLLLLLAMHTAKTGLSWIVQQGLIVLTAGAIHSDSERDTEGNSRPTSG
jgi:hypothetical protein